jgi:uroporphyrinogen decarboxylase
LFVPEYRRLFGYYKSHGVHISFHSCGRIQDIVDLFIDLGVDVLNPVQATANDLALLRQRTQGRMTLQGAIPSHVVADGPIEAIRRHVQEKIHLLGREGGYICQADQGLPFPAAHVQALEQAIDEFGRYPIRP